MSWEIVRFDIMEEISTAKLQNLRDNTETDSVWGCGQDLKRLNMMGCILMNVRKSHIEYANDYPPLPKPQQTNAMNTHSKKTKKTMKLYHMNHPETIADDKDPNIYREVDWSDDSSPYNIIKFDPNKMH